MTKGVMATKRQKKKGAFAPSFLLEPPMSFFLRTFSTKGMEASLAHVMPGNTLTRIPFHSNPSTLTAATLEAIKLQDRLKLRNCSTHYDHGALLTMLVCCQGFVIR